MTLLQETLLFLNFLIVLLYAPYFRLDDLQQLDVGTKSGNEQQSGGEHNAENFGGAGVGNNNMHSGPKHGQSGSLQQHMGGHSRGRGMYRINQPYYANNNNANGRNNSNGNYQFNNFQRVYEPSPSAQPPSAKCRW